MNSQKNIIQKIIAALKQKMRIVVFSNTSYSEKFALKVTIFGFLIRLIGITMIMFALIIVTISYTSLKEYIPGYGNIQDKKTIISIITKLDSIEISLKEKDWYLNNILNVLSGKLDYASKTKPHIQKMSLKEITVSPYTSEQKFRTDVEKLQTRNQLQFSTALSNNERLENLHFLAPLNNVILKKFKEEKKIYGIKIKESELDKVKSILDGIIIFNDKTMDGFHVLHIQHGNNLISTYKHISPFNLTLGTYVKAGENISLVSQESTLLFEMWYNGNPINPLDYITFNDKK